MKVSIGIPTYNRPEQLFNALRNCVIQSYKNIEIVVCDNGNNSDAKITCNKFGDIRIKYYKNQSNIGMKKNFQEVLNKSTGEFFILLSDDDYFELHAIEKFVASFNDSINCVISNVRIISQTKSRIFNLGQTIYGREVIEKYFANQIAVYPSATMFRKRKLQNLSYDLDNIQLAVDAYVLSKVWLSDPQRIKYIPDVLVNYLYHDSLSSSPSSIWKNDLMELRRLFLDKNEKKIAGYIDKSIARTELSFVIRYLRFKKFDIFIFFYIIKNLTSLMSISNVKFLYGQIFRKKD